MRRLFEEGHAYCTSVGLTGSCNTNARDMTSQWNTHVYANYHYFSWQQVGNGIEIVKQSGTQRGFLDVGVEARTLRSAFWTTSWFLAE